MSDRELAMWILMAIDELKLPFEALTVKLIRECKAMIKDAPEESPGADFNALVAKYGNPDEVWNG